MKNCCCVSMFSTCSKGLNVVFTIFIILVVITLACIMFKKLNVAKHVSGVKKDITSTAKDNNEQPEEKKYELKDLYNFKF